MYFKKNCLLLQPGSQGIRAVKRRKIKSDFRGTKRKKRKESFSLTRAERGDGREKREKI